MNRVLVVEDSQDFQLLLRRTLERRLGVQVVMAASLAEARQIIGNAPERFFLALLDLNLPDAPNGEAVEFVMKQGIPSVVITGSFDEELRRDLLGRGAIDYVVKESPATMDYIVFLVNRVSRNRDTVVMVVDDSRSARHYLVRLLNIYRFQVLQAENGVRALELLQQHRDVRLVVTDYSMPEMDGFELIKQIRKRYTRDQMAIIGLSSHGNQMLSARFIKNGANDFLAKPFLEEEFFCRIGQNMEMLDQVKALKEAAVRDFMTGLHNRRYFFETGEHMFASARRGQISVAVALVDVDFFKKVNDTYGHDAGDEVLKRMAVLLTDQFRQTDIVARFGGEEFCILMVNMDPDAAAQIFEEFRRKVEREEIVVGGKTIRITASMGVCCQMRESLTAMVSRADELLYQAKTTGRNRVVMEV